MEITKNTQNDYAVTVFAPRVERKHRQYVMKRSIKYKSWHEMKLGTIYPTQQELADDYMYILSFEIDGVKMCEMYELNPKLKPLIKTLADAKIPTTMSGDQYDNKIIYVDIGFDKRWILATSRAILPKGWNINKCHANYKPKTRSIRIWKTTSDTICYEEAALVRDALRDSYNNLFVQKDMERSNKTQ